MRLLWSLPKAAPSLLRHLAGYAELAVQDLERLHRDLGARLIASVIFGLSLFFVISLACLLVVAMTWDTPYRVPAIGWMVGGFIVVALIAGIYRSRITAAQAPFLATLRQEWRQDRVILDHIMSHDE